MTTDTTQVDRSKQDLSQPLDSSGPTSAQIHSDICAARSSTGLLDRITGGVTFEDNKLMKFHGDLSAGRPRHTRRAAAQKLEPAYTFMVACGCPGGVCTPEQWLKIDALARAHGGDQIGSPRARPSSSTGS
jgi:sulfite reductase (NADPH) hemoprotein beta-component